MSKTLIGAIPGHERLITIEDTLELVIPQPNHVRLLYSKDNIGLSRITAESLLQASLRMKPDRVLVQELRDDAAWTYINEVVSGHPGSITTIHGRNPQQAFKRLFALVKGSPQGGQWDDNTLMDFLSSAVDVIIPFQNEGSGLRHRRGLVRAGCRAARRERGPASEGGVNDNRGNGSIIVKIGFGIILMVIAWTAVACWSF